MRHAGEAACARRKREALPQASCSYRRIAQEEPERHRAEGQRGLPQQRDRECRGPRRYERPEDPHRARSRQPPLRLGGSTAAVAKHLPHEPAHGRRGDSGDHRGGRVKNDPSTGPQTVQEDVLLTRVEALVEAAGGLEVRPQDGEIRENQFPLIGGAQRAPRRVPRRAPPRDERICKDGRQKALEERASGVDARATHRGRLRSAAKDLQVQVDEARAGHAVVIEEDEEVAGRFACGGVSLRRGRFTSRDEDFDNAGTPPRLESRDRGQDPLGGPGSDDHADRRGGSSRPKRSSPRLGLILVSRRCDHARIPRASIAGTRSSCSLEGRTRELPVALARHLVFHCAAAAVLVACRAVRSARPSAEQSPRRMSTEAPNAHGLWAEFLVSRVLILVVTRAAHGDVPAYFDGMSRIVSRGSPYGEGGFGYPVLAALFVSIPAVFGITKIELYRPFYRAQCFAVDVLLFYLLARRCSRSALLVYLLCTTLLGSILYDRLDIVLGCLLFVALLLERGERSALGSLALGASVAFKVIPVVLLPVWLASAVCRSWRSAVGAAILVALGVAAPFGAGYFLWGEDALLFMRAHAARGVEVESTWATLQIGAALSGSGAPQETYLASGSYNLKTPHESVFVTISHGLVALAALWGAVLSIRLSRRGRPIIPAWNATLGACILSSKVFSPQFLLFFLPTLVWSLGSMSRGVRRATVALACAACALTTWVYPYHEGDLVALRAVATVPLIARNVCFFALVLVLQLDAWRAGGALDQRTAVPEAARAEHIG